MPELPEVETIANDLRNNDLLNRTITQVHVRWGRSIATPSPSKLSSELTGSSILSIDRRGKFLIISLSKEKKLFIHLRMTGKLDVVERHTPVLPHDRVIMELNHGKDLRFNDIRKFGKWYLPDKAETILSRLGPEPLDPQFTEEDFYKRLKAKDRILKPLLLDQSFIAGLGNIYVDEALWRASLHPLKKSGALNRTQISNLYESIRFVIQAGIDNLGTSLGEHDLNYYSVGGRRGSNQNYISVFRRTGLECLRDNCKGKITRLIVGQRSSHICPRCQRKPKQASY